ncbi:hypothetical protein B0H17DRAFT_1198415 [Mycena rosella]|uniref:Uncharacterized protein n=1 Tax=Mycena rosella TaxID=1033263 RepID=A0AAD7DQ60_MYCRO|nr:hypothetical protein B0H17DRAFT_1198415 [Mycena rosella]
MVSEVQHRYHADGEMMYLATVIYYGQRGCKQFSKFDDRQGYAGSLPSVGYLKGLFTDFVTAHHIYIERDISSLPLTIAKADHTFQFLKYIAGLKGEQIFNATYNILNEFEECRGHSLTQTKSLSFVQDLWERIQEDLKDAVMDNQAHTTEIKIWPSRSLIRISKVLVPGALHSIHGQTMEWIFTHSTHAVVTTSQLHTRNETAPLLSGSLRIFAVPAIYTPPTLLSASLNLSPVGIAAAAATSIANAASAFAPFLDAANNETLAVDSVDRVFPAIAKLANVFEQTSCQLNSQLALINRNALQRVEGETRDEHYSEDSEGAGQGDERVQDGTDEDVHMCGVESSGTNNASEMGGCRSGEMAPDGGKRKWRNVPSDIMVALDMVAEVATGASSVPAAPVATPPHIFHSSPSTFKHSSVFFGSHTSPLKTPSGLSHKFSSSWIPSAASASPNTAKSGDTSLLGTFGMPEHLASPAPPSSRKILPDDVQVDSHVDGSSMAGAASGQ